MPVFQRGALGGEVERIQERLKTLRHYNGPVDGIFGAGTAMAVKAFQRSAAIAADGAVGSVTWKALFSEEETPVPAIVQQSLAERCLALTGSFETSMPPPECFSGLTGDFDDQGISFGALQWCLGQGSLQPLLERVNAQHGPLVEEIFDDHCDEFRVMLDSSRSDQMQWARSIQDTRHRIVEPWRGMFKTLGRREEYRQIQVEAASHLFEDALRLCHEFGLRSERAVALMFDIRVQNGSIQPLTAAQIRQDFRTLEQAGTGQDEEPKLRAVAERRAAAANPRWIEDVRRRKLTIATGGGTVHGRPYDLASQYGITMAPAL